MPSRCSLTNAASLLHTVPLGVVGQFETDPLPPSVVRWRFKAPYDTGSGGARLRPAVEARGDQVGHDLSPVGSEMTVVGQDGGAPEERGGVDDLDAVAGGDVAEYLELAALGVRGHDESGSGA